MEGKETTSELGKIQCNTLLMLGREDLFYKEEMSILRENIANNKFIEVENCGHMISFEKPELVTYTNIYGERNLSVDKDK